MATEAAWAVFLRAANVGGHNVFKPKAFASDHPELELTNIGAAGTFVSRVADAADLQAGLRAALPVAVEMAIVPLAHVQRLVAEGPWPLPADAKQEVSVHLAPVGVESVPPQWPSDQWEIQVVAELDWCVVTNRRPGGRLTPYQVIAQATGVACTTRSWGVMEKVAKG